MQLSQLDFRHAVALSDQGLTVGPDTCLAHFSDGTSRLVVDMDRLSGLLAVASGRPLTHRDVSTIAAAAGSWDAGDKALANIRLALSGLHCPDAPQDLQRLKAAEILFDAGLSADDLARTFEDVYAGCDLGKGNPDQPRVPAGSGPTSGEWTKGLWNRFRAWLDEDVPVYDMETGDEVGTQSRARAIAMNPLTILVAGAAVVLAGEMLLPAAAIGSLEAAGTVTVVEGAAVIAETAAVVGEEAEALTPFAQRYLSTSGGRLGNTATRRQLYEIAREYYTADKNIMIKGDGHGPEEFLRDATTGRGTFVDLTVRNIDGTTIRIQTIDTLADGVTPTARELAAAGRIRLLRPTDQLHLVPKK